MATFFLFVFVFVFLCQARAQANNAAIDGYWLTEAGEVISIAMCEERSCVRIDSGPLQGRLIADVSSNGPRHTGYLLDPEEEEVFRGALIQEGDRLVVQSCWIEVFCSDVQTWRRFPTSSELRRPDR